MRIDVISFTDRGLLLSVRTALRLRESGFGEAVLYTKHRGSRKESGVQAVEESIYEWTAERFRRQIPILFIGACGIAVRAAAPAIRDKLTDIPVLVMDEAGCYVIPILSGHWGGANRLANCLAELLGARAIITTATDVNGRFAVDVFARENGLSVFNKEGIAAVSARLLAGRQVTAACEREIAGTVPDGVCVLGTGEDGAWDMPDIWIGLAGRRAVLWLIPRCLVLGMGCKKGKTCAQIEAFVKAELKKLGLPIQAAAALATIDCKREEPGFLEFADKYRLSFVTYGSEALARVPGDFSASDFVQSRVGVDNVCERAAIAACRADGNEGLLLAKTAREGMTLAVAKRKWSVTWDEA